MTRITCAGAVVAALLATGCIQSSTLIKVKADGSGTTSHCWMKAEQAHNDRAARH